MLNLKTNLTHLNNSRLSRNRHNSLERSLLTITHGISSLSMQQHSEIIRMAPNIASNVNFGCAASRAEERETTDLRVGSSNLVQNDHLDSSEAWGVPRKNAMTKQTLWRTGSILDFFLGTIHATSSTSLRSSTQLGDPTPYRKKDQYESESSYIMYPAPWLIRLGFQYGLHLGFLSSSTQGWKSTLKTFCPVPDDSLIFKFCKQGNVIAVRTLLSDGHASARDTDSSGYTPLHVSRVSETNLKYESA